MINFIKAHFIVKQIQSNIANGGFHVKITKFLIKKKLVKNVRLPVKKACFRPIFPGLFTSLYSKSFLKKIQT